VLKKLQLETKLARLETDISRINFNDGRASDIRPNDVCTENPIRVDGALESPKLVE
jgi:hypothetical protein